MAGKIDIKAKPRSPAELIIGLTLVSHGLMSLDTEYGQDWMLQDCQINFPGCVGGWLRRLCAGLRRLWCGLSDWNN